MAINIRAPALLCILMHLLVFFATNAHARDAAQHNDIGANDFQAGNITSFVAQDIKANDLQAKNTTSQFDVQVRVLPRPGKPRPERPQSHRDFLKALRKGCGHLNMLARDNVDQSPFTDDKSLSDNGWTETRTTQRAYGSEFPSGQSYGRTGGNYQNQINADAGMLLSLNNYSPSYMINMTYGTGPAPPLNRLSDILWLQWGEAVQARHALEDVKGYGNIKWFYQHTVADDFSMSIMDEIQSMPNQTLLPYPGNTYSMTDGKVNGDIARAILGSSNGNVVAFFLAQHRAKVGKKLTVSKVQFFSDAKVNEYDRHFLFHIVEVVEWEKAKKLNGTTTETIGENSPAACQSFARVSSDGWNASEMENFIASSAQIFFLRSDGKNTKGPSTVPFYHGRD
ncbi:Mitochondrial import inner membrane translocase subunit tim8 [Elasticomyces elasticus]|nr:Mitochondrial import inner membrane translocase subunit tim8 [Elasticomyces elasticus]